MSVYFYLFADVKNSYILFIYLDVLIYAYVYFL